MNAVLYARVSTEKQADKDLSIPAQLQAMRDYAKHRNWTVVTEFLEPGVSAKTAERPALRELLSAIRSSEPRIDVLIVHKVDRLARNVYDHATIRALLKSRGIRLASVVENVDDTVSGQLVENIMASIAQFYSANLGEEVKKGMRQRVMKGGWPHRPPLGYKAVARTEGRPPQVQFDPILAPKVRLAFELYSTGNWGIRALAAHLRQEGLVSKAGGPVCQSLVRIMLSNPFYIGRVRWMGEEYPGAHQSLVPEDLFERVQRVIRRRYVEPRLRLASTEFPLKAVAVCSSCRGTMTAERHGVFSYYRCCRRMHYKELCPARFCNADTAHSAIAAICRELTLDKGVLADIQRAADEILEQRAKSEAGAHASLERDRAQLLKQEMGLTKEFVDGNITPQVYNEQIAAVRREIGIVAKRLVVSPEHRSQLQEHVAATLYAAAHVQELFEELSPQRQAELLHAVFESVVLTHTGVVGYSLREPFRSVWTKDSEHGKRTAPLSPHQLADAVVTAFEPADIEARAHTV